MHTMQLTADSFTECVRCATACIRDGGVVMIPTDTCYGLAADPNNTQALKKLFSIKDRDEDKKISSIYSSIDHIASAFPLSPWQRSVLEKNLPGPFTFIVNGTGVRVPQYAFTQALAKELGAPYTATSANRSSNEPLYSVTTVEQEFGAVLPDLVIDAGTLPPNPPSTVVDISNDNLTIVRVGAQRPIV